MSETRGERLYSANELAKAVGVAATTIRNWTSRSERALGTVATPSGRQMYRLSDLSTFITQNPDLRTAHIISERFAAVTSGGTYRVQHDQDGPAPMTDQALEEAEYLRSAIRDLRTAVEASVQAVVRSAELAEQTAAAHREVIAALQVTVRAYDSAMAITYSSRTLHD